MAGRIPSAFMEVVLSQDNLSQSYQQWSAHMEEMSRHESLSKATDLVRKLEVVELDHCVFLDCCCWRPKTWRTFFISSLCVRVQLRQAVANASRLMILRHPLPVKQDELKELVSGPGRLACCRVEHVVALWWFCLSDRATPHCLPAQFKGVCSGPKQNTKAISTFSSFQYVRHLSVKRHFHNQFLNAIALIHSGHLDQNLQTCAGYRLVKLEPASCEWESLLF